MRCRESSLLDSYQMMTFQTLIPSCKKFTKIKTMRISSCSLNLRAGSHYIHRYIYPFQNLPQVFYFPDFEGLSSENSPCHNDSHACPCGFFCCVRTGDFAGEAFAGVLLGSKCCCSERIDLDGDLERCCARVAAVDVAVRESVLRARDGGGEAVTGGGICESLINHRLEGQGPRSRS